MDDPHGTETLVDALLAADALPSGTLVAFRTPILVRSRFGSGEGSSGTARFPREGHAYVVRGQFQAGRIDVEERTACRSRPKLGLPKGEVTCVILNVPLEWLVFKRAEKAEVDSEQGKESDKRRRRRSRRGL